MYQKYAVALPKFMLRVHDLSGSVARHLSGRHIAPKGVIDEPNETATGVTEDEFHRSVGCVECGAADAGRGGSVAGHVRAQFPALSGAV